MCHWHLMGWNELPCDRVCYWSNWASRLRLASEWDVVKSRLNGPATLWSSAIEWMSLGDGRVHLMGWFLRLRNWVKWAASFSGVAIGLPWQGSEAAIEYFYWRRHWASWLPVLFFLCLNSKSIQSTWKQPNMQCTCNPNAKPS